MHALVLLAAAALPACPPGGYGGQFAGNGFSPYGYGGGGFPASTQLQFELDRGGNGHRHFRPFFRPQPRERLFLSFNQQQQLSGFPGYGGGWGGGYPVSPYGYGGGYGGGFSPSPYGYGGGFSPYGYAGGFGRGG
jgi:hypothetical protein